MELHDVGQIIASRTLTMKDETGSLSEVSILLGKPRRLPDHEDFYCPYQIKGVGSEKVGHACGIDLLQALLMALAMLEVQVEVLNKELSGKLHWDGATKGRLGLPSIPPAML